MKRQYRTFGWLAGAFAFIAAGPSALANGVVLSTFSFTATVPSGPYAGTTGTGVVQYNSALVLPDPNWAPYNDEDFALTFTLFGQTFHETDDTGYDLYPQVTFDAGVPVSMSFRVSELPEEGLTTEINEPGIYNFWVEGELTPSIGIGSLVGAMHTYNVGPFATDPIYLAPLQINVVVPEASGVAFASVAGLGLGGLAFFRRYGRAPLS